MRRRGASNGGGLAFKKAGHGYAAEGELKDAPAELVVVLPGAAGRSVAVEKRPHAAATVEDLDEQAAAGAKDGRGGNAFEPFEHYFLVSDTPPGPATGGPGRGGPGRRGARRLLPTEAAGPSRPRRCGGWRSCGTRG